MLELSLMGPNTRIIDSTREPAMRPLDIHFLIGFTDHPSKAKVDNKELVRGDCLFGQSLAFRALYRAFLVLSH